MKKKISPNPLKAEWDKSKGNLTRKCNVCQKPFKVEHWNQTVCKDPICKEYTFCTSHIKSSYKRWQEVSKKIKELGYKPSITFTNYK